MPQIPSNVSPGDLITANFFNATLAVLADHEARLKKLEGAVSSVGSTPVITQVVPAGGVHPGDTLQLIGNNFGVPSLNAVTIAGATVASFTPDSTNTLLKFTVPAIAGIPASGQTATLNLSNPNGFTTATIYLLPSQPAVPQGQLFVAMSKTASVTTVTAGSSPLIFQFEVKGNASQNETYTVTPTVDLGWPAALVTASGAAITPSQIPLTLDANGNFDTFFYMSVTVPAGTANAITGKLQVAVASVLNPLGLNNNPVPTLSITVGSAPPPPQNAIIVGFSDVVNAKSTTNAKGVTTVTVTAGSQAAIDLTAVTQTAGSYDVPVPIASPATGWTIALAHAAAAGDYPFTTTSTSLSAPVRVLLTGAADAAAATLTITVVSKSNTSTTGQLQLDIQTG
jgi:hypothetical protein